MFTVLSPANVADFSVTATAPATARRSHGATGQRGVKA
ncbi:MAG: hypothetical protein QOD01_1723, partial [Actinomycetota bacterium]|nr:hypothetical protein [Actinomycetota bacterium]